jgi:glyoxalase family protein
MAIQGIHHITLVCANAQRTADFYVGMLGLRLVKQTVNFDQPDTRHLYFGDATGAPGTLVTFFEWPEAVRGLPGIGGTHHFALTVESTNAQLKWKRWLEDHGLRVDGPYDRGYFYSIYVRDPDGSRVEIATRWPGMTADEDVDDLGRTVQAPPADATPAGRDEAAIRAQTWPEPIRKLTPDMALTGLHHISAVCADLGRTAAFYTETLDLRVVKRTVNYEDQAISHWYFGAGEGAPGTLISYFAYPAGAMRPARIGSGQTHHFALCVEDEAEQAQWQERLLAAGVQVTPVLDRKYFRSIYFHDPDGHTVEISTRGPGFLIDEPVDRLGESLALPAWLEEQRETLASRMAPVVAGSAPEPAAPACGG